MSNLNKWSRVFPGQMHKDDHGPMGPSESYKAAAQFLEDCALIEDWGCGRAHFSTLMAPGQVRNVDGTNNPHVDVHVDLAEYTSDVPGISMRHVLEHNFQWLRILENALQSFRERMVLTIYTPMLQEPVIESWHPVTMKVLDVIENWDFIPVLSLRRKTLEDALARHGVTWTFVKHDQGLTDYGVEYSYYLTK